MISSTGFDDLQFFMGIVENNSDVARQGRVQVRCFGIHPPADSGDVLTEDLPWAPVLNAGHYGTVIPTKGDWVFGAFIDGRDAQHPFVLGTIPGMNNQLPTDSGSSDPYTKASREAFANYGEPPLPKAQGGEDLETTQMVLQNACLMEYAPAKDQAGVSRGYSINEPPIPYATEAHKNAVWKSRNSNSYLQVSEGEGQEHILLSHESGSHIQIDKNGNVKIKSFGDLYSLSEGHQFEGGKGSKTLTIEGQYSLKCKNATIEVEGDMNHVVTGDYNLNVGGRIGMVAGAGFEIAAQRVSVEATTEHINFKAAEKFKVQAGGSTSIKASGKFNIETESTLSMKSKDNMNIDGKEIHLNEGLSESVSGADLAASPKLSQPVSQTLSVETQKITTSNKTIGAGSIDGEDT